MGADVVLAGDRLGVFASAVLAFGVGWIGWGAILIQLATAARHSRLRARAARLAREGNPVLEPGWTVLTGGVVADEPEVPVIVTVITQTTTPSTSHEWREQSRAVVAHPFYLTLDDGETVRVEPDERVCVVDELETQQKGPYERRRVAEIEAGQTATVCGVLGRGFNPRAQDRGYRANEDGLVLRPPAPTDGRMLVSNEPLEASHVARERLARTWPAIGFTGALAVNAGLFGPFTLLAAFGEEQRVVVTAEPRGPKGALAPRVSGKAFVGDREVTFSDDVGAETWERVSMSEGPASMPFLVVPFAPVIHAAGAQPTMRGLLAAAGLLVTLGFVAVRWLVLRAARPWWERERLDEAIRRGR